MLPSLFAQYEDSVKEDPESTARQKLTLAHLIGKSASKISKENRQNTHTLVIKFFSGKMQPYFKP